MHETKAKGGQAVTRRHIVKVGACTGVVIATAAGALVCACGEESDEADGNAGASVETTSGVTTLDFASYQDLKTVGGSYRVSIDGKPVSVTRTSTNTVVAVVARCTHEGAILKDYDNGQFTCPRHGARFTADGTVTKGPARTNLTQYTATLEATGVSIKST